LPAGLCELGVEPASIVGGWASGDVPERLEALDKTRASAAAEQYLLGELCHANSSVGRVVEEDQNLALRQRQAVRSPHLNIQLVEHVRVNL
jgi:hypothetical protein